MTQKSLGLVENHAQGYTCEVFNGAESGIFLSGNSNVVTDNVITEAAIGLLKETGSSGNIIARNRFFNTPVAVQDPQFKDAAKLISPKR